MGCRLASLFMIGIILTCAGCGDRPAPTTPSQAKPVSVNYEIRDPAGGFSKGTCYDGVFTAGGDKLKLEIKDGRVRANGKDCGTVKDGDSVLLDKDGKLTVNGQPREPE
jgi:hypothetical protein